MTARKTLNKDILLYEIDVYCSTMANFWHDKNDNMYINSRQGIYTIIGLMVAYMGESEEKLKSYAREKLNCYLIANDEEIATDRIYKEI